MKIPKNNLLVLSGNDTNFLWWFCNRQRDSVKLCKIYEMVNPKSLLWHLDEIDSDDTIGNIELCILIIPCPHSYEIKAVNSFKRNRMLDWHIFLHLEKKYTGEYPAVCHIWKNGIYNG